MAEPKTRLYSKQLAKITKIGEGAYGSVYKAYEIQDKDKSDDERQYFVIKKMGQNNFYEGINFSALREIKILKEIKHQNVLQLIDVVFEKKSLYLSYEFLDLDLHKLIHLSKNTVLEEKVIKAIMLNLLEGLKVIHKHGVLHRDLKPQNILISNKGIVKIADFGMARYISSYNREMTRNVVTNWYRSPELFFGSSCYTSAIDMWSLGCIFGEMMQKDPLFYGDGDIQILTKIFSLIGVPSENVWEGVSELINFKSFIKGDVVGVKNKFNFMSEETTDLLEKLLILDPLNRISAEEALKHKCFTSPPYPSSQNELSAFLKSVIYECP